MKRALLLFLISFSVTAIWSQYSINLNYSQAADTVVYFRLVTFDDKQYLPKDTVLIKRGKATIKSATPIFGGIYYLYFPITKTRLYISIDNKDNFDITLNGNHILDSVLSNDPKNTIFFAYQKLENQFKHIDSTYSEMKKRGEGKLSDKEVLFKPKIKTLTDFRTKALAGLPKTSSLNNYFSSLNELDAFTPGKKNPTSRDIFLNKFDFESAQLYFSPAFKEILYEYISSYPLQSDSTLKAIDTLMKKIKCKNKAYPNTFHYIASVLQNNSIKENRDGYIRYIDKYLYQCNNFPGKNKAGSYISVYNQMKQLNQIDTVYNVVLKDTTGKHRSLQEFLSQNDYTIISFYDPSCEHCKLQLPEVDSIMHYVNNRNRIRIGQYAICSTPEMMTKEWKHFVEEHKLNKNYVHVILGNDEEVRKKYSAYSTPSFFLSDRSGKLLLKKTNVIGLQNFLKQL